VSDGACHHLYWGFFLLGPQAKGAPILPGEPWVWAFHEALIRADYDVAGFAHRIGCNRRTLERLMSGHRIREEILEAILRELPGLPDPRLKLDSLDDILWLQLGRRLRFFPKLYQARVAELEALLSEIEGDVE
jgi:hypothetical protein